VRRSGRHLPKALAMWRKAVVAEGYLQKGQFKPMPKKGTAGYKAIRARYMKLMAGSK
jgi:hypothetical protein